MEGILILLALGVLYYLVYKPRSDKKTETYVKDLSDERLIHDYQRHLASQGGYKTGGSHMKDMRKERAYKQELRRRNLL